MNNLKEEDVVMCTVKSIEGTTVFVHIEGDGEGSIMMSEIAAGRIRNLREYVALNKKIVCKILKASQSDIQLSLRRVTDKERREVEERYRKEKTLSTICAAALDNPETLLEKIKKKHELHTFFDRVKEDPSLLEEFCTKPQAQAIARMLLEKKEKEKEVKKVFIIKSFTDRGVNDVREVLTLPGVEIRYLGSSQFSVKATASDFKEANHKVTLAIAEIEKRAKDKKLVFEYKEK